jgi:hypothetical protein|tara:strand:+ start:8884 stop:9078 length:195 start_codon:yes stop_codon:yes gene_type:complete
MKEVHKKAEVYITVGKVILWKNYEQFGTVDISEKSIHYANDVAENWENGILKEDNEYIIKLTNQ